MQHPAHNGKWELALHSLYPSQWPGVEGVGAWRVAPFRPQQGALAQRFHGDGRLGSLIPPTAVRERDAVPHEGLWVQLTSGLVAQKRADLDAGTPAESPLVSCDTSRSSGWHMGRQPATRPQARLRPGDAQSSASHVRPSASLAPA
jgi:hypothetical protein